MTYNTDELNQLKALWRTAEAETAELQFPVPNGPQLSLNAVPIPISSTARQKAEQMANLCRNDDRREIMRRNLLATVAVHDYLKLQGYVPDLRASDSWNPILGRTGETADLVVSQVGRLECCAIQSEQLSCAVPAEGQFGRSGYVAVELDGEERWGWLLGFMPGRDEINPAETLHREELQSMDEFGHLLHRLWLLWNIVQEGSEPWDVELRGEMVTRLERIYRTHGAPQRPMRAIVEMAKLWEEEVAEVKLRELAGAGNREGDSTAQFELQQFFRGVFDRLEKAVNQKLVHLSQWLNNRLEESRSSLEELTPAFRSVGSQVQEGWQHLEALLSAEELTPALSMRSNFPERAKLIRLATEITQRTIILIVRLMPKSEQDINIIVEVRPYADQRYLPENLQVRVLDDQQRSAMEAIASRTNQNIQFDFDVVSGERFSVQMILERASVTEEFIM
jgi:hypothetical protein